MAEAWHSDDSFSYDESNKTNMSRCQTENVHKKDERQKRESKKDKDKRSTHYQDEQQSFEYSFKTNKSDKTQSEIEENSRIKYKPKYRTSEKDKNPEKIAPNTFESSDEIEEQFSRMEMNNRDSNVAQESSESKKTKRPTKTGEHGPSRQGYRRHEDGMPADYNFSTSKREEANSNIRHAEPKLNGLENINRKSEGLGDENKSRNVDDKNRYKNIDHRTDDWQRSILKKTVQSNDNIEGSANPDYNCAMQDAWGTNKKKRDTTEKTPRYEREIIMDGSNCSSSASFKTISRCPSSDKNSFRGYSHPITRSVSNGQERPSNTRRRPNTSHNFDEDDKSEGTTDTISPDRKSKQVDDAHETRSAHDSDKSGRKEHVRHESKETDRKKKTEDDRSDKNGRQQKEASRRSVDSGSSSEHDRSQSVENRYKKKHRERENYERECEHRHKENERNYNSDEVISTKKQRDRDGAVRNKEKLGNRSDLRNSKGVNIHGASGRNRDQDTDSNSGHKKYRNTHGASGRSSDRDTDSNSGHKKYRNTHGDRGRSSDRDTDSNSGHKKYRNTHGDRGRSSDRDTDSDSGHKKYRNTHGDRGHKKYRNTHGDRGRSSDRDTDSDSGHKKYRNTHGDRGHNRGRSAESEWSSRKSNNWAEEDETHYKYEWQFENEFGNWITYGYDNSGRPLHGASIVTSNQIEMVFKKHDTMMIEANNNRYRLDFQNMRQTNVNTSVHKRIRRVRKSSSPGRLERYPEHFENHRPAETNGSSSKLFVWQYEDDAGNWKTYGSNMANSTTSDDIESFRASDPSNISMQIQVGRGRYLLNFNQMKQVNVDTHHQRRIRRVPKSTNPKFVNDLKQLVLQLKNSVSGAWNNGDNERYEWQFEDERGQWITYGHVNTNGIAAFSTLATSDDIEKYYSTSPNKAPVTISSRTNTYLLDFDAMTQVNQNTNVRRKIRRVMKTSSNDHQQRVNQGGVPPHGGGGFGQGGVPLAPHGGGGFGQGGVPLGPHGGGGFGQRGVPLGPHGGGGFDQRGVPLGPHGGGGFGQGAVPLGRGSPQGFNLGNHGVHHQNMSSSPCLWQFLDENGIWITYGQPSSKNQTSGSTVTSDDIERYFLSNPGTTNMVIQIPPNNYVLDNQKMTQTNMKTRIQKRIRRVVQ